MTLREKIDHEYRRFYLDQMRTSRENIFAHSGEIECKKRIKKSLDEMLGRIDPATEELLLVQDSLLESAFRFVQDEGADGLSGQALGEEMGRWLSFVKTA